MINFTFKKPLKKYGANIMSECCFDKNYGNSYCVEIFDSITDFLYNNEKNNIINSIRYHTKGRKWKIVSYAKLNKTQIYINKFELYLDELPEGANINSLQEKINGYENQKDV